MTLGALLVVAIGVILILPMVSAGEQELTDSRYGNESELKLQLERQGIRYFIQRRDAIVRLFIKSGTYQPLEGKISAVTRHILVIMDEDETINVLMPNKWVIDGNILSTQDLLDGNPLGLGDIASIETLMLELDRETHVITSYLAYSIQVGEEAATALLPFNIEVMTPIE